MIKTVIERGLHNAEIGPGGLTVLMYCAQESNVECLKLLLDAVNDPNKQDIAGRTALHYACFAGRYEMVAHLAEKKEINLEARTCGGETPLMCAIQSGSKRTVVECTNNHFNPYAFNNLLTTPMDYAKKFPNADLDREDFCKLI